MRLEQFFFEKRSSKRNYVARMEQFIAIEKRSSSAIILHVTSWCMPETSHIRFFEKRSSNGIFVLRREKIIFEKRSSDHPVTEWNIFARPEQSIAVEISKAILKRSMWCMPGTTRLRFFEKRSSNGIFLRAWNNSSRRKTIL